MQSYTSSPHIRTVGSFDQLVGARFGGGINAICWPRTLPGDFREVVVRLGAGEGITSIDDVDLRALTLSPAGCTARDVLLADQELLRAHGLAPTLDCINGYPREDAVGPVATDVYSFHVDSAPVEADTYLCTYAGASTELLANGSAVRRVDVDETRRKLIDIYGGADDEGFATFLREHCFDLHYVPIREATPTAAGLHNLWRIAIDYPGAPVPPCIHRAPPTRPGDPTRLLLIS